MYVADEVFEKATGKKLSDYVDDDKLKASAPVNRDLEFNWTEDDPESMKRLCPKLFERFAETTEQT